MDSSWMKDARDEFIDIHEDLHTYAETLSFFRALEAEANVGEYCNGSNAGGRWVFQILNKEFIAELAETIGQVLASTSDKGPVLEVMAGDGRLTEFLKPLVNREIVSTDSKDGRYNIAYPKWIAKMDALDSIKHYHPSFVVLSWEPFLSMAGVMAIRTRVPIAWIGNPERCGHTNLFKKKHLKKQSRYALCRHDSFAEDRFVSDLFLFNCKEKWFSSVMPWP